MIRKFYDRIITETGWIDEANPDKIVYLRSITFQPIIGIGAWKDVYKKDNCGIDGVAWNIILPFIRMQFTALSVPNNPTNNSSLINKEGE